MVDYALLKGNGMKNLIHFLESATKEASIALPVVLSREMLKKKKELFGHLRESHYLCTR
jgi:hypothetical protein